MKTIAIINQKGGVGKTTTAVQLAACLSMKGYRVLACDLDAQANLTATLLGDSVLPRGSLTMYEVLTREAAASDALIHVKRGCLLPASQTDKHLSIIDAAIGNHPDKLYRLRDALATVADEFDFAIVDTPPARDTLAYNALTAADGIIVPTVAGEYSLTGIADLAESIEQTRRYTNPDLRILGVLITQHRANTRLARGMAKGAQSVAEELGTRAYPIAIREAIAIGESQASYTDIFEYAGDSGVADDYRAMVEEVLKEVIDGE